jgi:DNA primase
MSAVDEVKQKIDIVEIIGQYTTLKKAGKNLTALCPFHSEKNPSFFVYPEQQSWHCFGACNTGGDVFSFLMKKEGLDFGEALRRLAQKAGVALPSRAAPGTTRDEKEEFYQINEAAALYFHNLLQNSPAAQKARDYIAKRGFTPATVSNFQLGFSLESWEALKQYLKEKGYEEGKLLAAGLLVQSDDGKTHDRFRGKLIIPIRDSRGRVTGFGARVLDDSLPKYVNSPQTPVFDKSSTLYGIDRAAAAIRQQDSTIIMEGYMDVITAHQNGITNVVASMGTSITEKQVNILKKLSRNILLAFDADVAGIEASLRGGEIITKPSEEDLAPQRLIKPGSPTLNLNEAEVRNSPVVGTIVINEDALKIDVKIIKLIEGKDPDEVIKKDINTWKRLVSEAVPIYDNTFEKVTAKLDLNTARDKSLVVEKLLPVVAEIKDPVRQAHYMGKLARLAGVTERTLEAALSRLKPPSARRKASEPAVGRALRPLVSNPREEYCLALLLQYPELKSRRAEISPEYFESSENREIFNAWQEADGLISLKERLDPAMHEHLDALIKRSLPATRNSIETRYNDCVMELRRKYLRSLAARKAESGDTGTDTAWLEEDVAISAQLRDLDAHKKRKQAETRR